MNEQILTNKKHGMAVLLLTLLLYIAAIVVLVFASTAMLVPLMVVCIVYLCLGWLTLPGLKVLGPQEALVLTLFGNYVGTLKGEQGGRLEKDLLEDHDLEQHPAEDQRLPGQPGGDRHRRNLAGGGYRQGGL